MNCKMKLQAAAPSLALGLAIGFIAPSNAATPVAATGPAFVVVQAMVPPTGMNDAEKPMPMEERMLRALSAARARRRPHRSARAR